MDVLKIYFGGGGGEPQEECDKIKLKKRDCETGPTVW
jgi:hypothetical protein